MQPRPILFVALLTFLSASAFGQAASTPFSSFGVGEYYGNALANSQGMAGVGVANPQFLWTNNLNPALLIFNGLGGITTFQAGVVGESRTLKDASNKESHKGGNLNYLLLGVPLKGGKWVTSIGIMPYTTVNYRYSYIEAVEGGSANNQVQFTETGSGGINQLAWSHGVAVTKWLSLGARASYLYSSIEYNSANTVVLDNQTDYFTPVIYERHYYNGFAFNGAASFHLDSLFGGKYKLNIGAVYDFKANVRTQYFQSLIRRNSGGNQVGADTLTNITWGDTQLPSIFSTGFSFGAQDGRWIIAADYRVSNYGEYRPFKQQTISAQNGWKAAVGLEVTPNPNSLSSYLKVITYRAGVSIEEYPYLVNGSPLRDFGTNFGLSLPVGRGCSLDLAGRWGKRGNIDINTIEEKYFKIYFGVTFNDRWFIKRKFD